MKRGKAASFLAPHLRLENLQSLAIRKQPFRLVRQYPSFGCHSYSQNLTSQAVTTVSKYWHGNTDPYTAKPGMVNLPSSSYPLQPTLICFPNFHAFDIFPNNESMSQCLASLHRVLAGTRSPASSVLSRQYDTLPSIPPHFVAFAWRYHRSNRPISSLPTPPTAGCRAWGWSPGIPCRDFFRGDDRASQVPGEPPYPFAHVLRPRPAEASLTTSRTLAWPPRRERRRRRRQFFRGSTDAGVQFTSLAAHHGFQNSLGGLARI